MKIYRFTDWKNYCVFTVVGEDLTDAHKRLFEFFKNKNRETCGYWYRDELDDYKKINPENPSTFLHLQTNRYEMEEFEMTQVLEHRTN